MPLEGLRLADCRSTVCIPQVPPPAVLDLFELKHLFEMLLAPDLRVSEPLQMIERAGGSITHLVFCEETARTRVCEVHFGSASVETAVKLSAALNAIPGLVVLRAERLYFRRS